MCSKLSRRIFLLLSQHFRPRTLQTCWCSCERLGNVLPQILLQHITLSPHLNAPTLGRTCKTACAFMLLLNGRVLLQAQQTFPLPCSFVFPMTPQTPWHFMTWCTYSHSFSIRLKGSIEGFDTLVLLKSTPQTPQT